MKYNCIIILFLCFHLSADSLIFGQDCIEFYRSQGCTIDLKRDYKMYSQSKSSAISVNDPVEMDIIFYGQKDYILYFCTDPNLYPINFRIIDPSTGDLIYDNTEDKYTESLNVGFEVVRSLKVQIRVLGTNSGSNKANDINGCAGLLIQYKNFSKTRDFAQLY